MAHGVDRSGAASGSGASDDPITEALIDAKGDLIAGSAADTPVRVAVGANETRLVADSAQTSGLKYVADTTNYAVAAKGDLLAGTAADTVAPITVGTDGYVLKPNSGSTTGLVWMPPTKDAPFHNVEISESHTGNAVTYTLSGWGGTALSTTNPGYIFFPSSTLTSASWDIVKLTANITITVSSGSTLGHADAKAQHTFIYAINNAGTAELAVSNLPPDYPGTFLGQRKISTTAEGGAGAADSATTIYSTTLRSNVTWVALAKVLGTQTTAGTWAANPTQIDMAPFSLPASSFSVHRNGSGQGGVVTATATKVQHTTEEFDTDGTFDNVTNYRYQPNVAGEYLLSAGILVSDSADNGVVESLVYKNGSAYKMAYKRSPSTSNDAANVSIVARLNGTSDYLEHFAYHERGSNATFEGNTAVTFFMGKRIGE